LQIILRGIRGILNKQTLCFPEACAHARGGSTSVVCTARVLHHIEDFPCLGNPVLTAVPITPAPCGRTAASSASTSASAKRANGRPRRTKRPTLLLDIGNLMGSLVGQSELNVRQALKIADAMSPCILFVDEVEKALAGLGSQGDSGVSTRLFEFLAGADGLRVWVTHQEVAAEYRMPDTRPADTLRLPLEALSAFAGRGEDAVNLDAAGPDKVLARWSDGGVPQAVEYESPDLTTKPTFPPLVVRMVMTVGLIVSRAKLTLPPPIRNIHPP
jgi:ATPase family associated with various cellular activities (AAA)